MRIKSLCLLVCLLAMPAWAGTLIKNTGSQPVPFTLLQADGTPIQTTVGVTVTVGLDTTTLGASGASPTVSGGQLYYTPTQAETNGNRLIIHATHADAEIDYHEAFTTVPITNSSGQVGVSAIANGAIVAATLGDGALTAAKFGTDYITQDSIADAAIIGTHLASSAKDDIAEEVVGQMEAPGTKLTLTLEDTAYIQPRIPASGTVATAADVGNIVAGTTQPRVNKPAGRSYRIQVSSLSDGTYKCTRPIRLRPGALAGDGIPVGIDMSPQFGDTFVETVGTPVVSGGSLTADDLGPRDTEAMVIIDGTATASENRTITVPVTMDTGETVDVTFDVKVFAE